MARRGYYSEDKIKKMLKKQYPDSDIIRNQIADFMVIQKGKILKIVEVKSIHQKKYYPTPREKRQIKKIKEFSIKHNIDSEIWLDRIGSRIQKDSTTSNPKKRIRFKGIEITYIHKVW